MAFNAMFDHLRNPSVNTATFARSLKTNLFTTFFTSTLSALEVLPRNALDKSTYLLTYLLIRYGEIEATDITGEDACLKAVKLSGLRLVEEMDYPV